MSNLRGSYRVALKRLAAVESSRGSSNQHELNGSATLRALLGDQRRERMPVRWVLLTDEAPPRIEPDTYTWYDSREKLEHRNAEWRFYYYGEPEMSAGDLLCCIRRGDEDELSLLVARPGSSWECQLLRLLGEPELGSGKFVVASFETVPVELAGIASELLEVLGWLDATIQAREADVELMFQQFGDHFPTTREFSSFARSRVDVRGVSDDDLLLAWWEKEEGLFRAFEERDLSARLARTPPFSGVEDFVGFSLSVQNRRKSRAGHALENHVEALLARRGIRASRGARTEGNRRPDFLLPGASEYLDPSFPAARLQMLATKTTCKDRWRQVLDEAARIKVKHLLTLEAAISGDQLRQMAESSLVLVAPRRILGTYPGPAAAAAISVGEFLDLAAGTQA